MLGTSRSCGKTQLCVYWSIISCLCNWPATLKHHLTNILEDQTNILFCKERINFKFFKKKFLFYFCSFILEKIKELKNISFSLECFNYLEVILAHLIYIISLGWWDKSLKAFTEAAPKYQWIEGFGSMLYWVHHVSFSFLHCCPFLSFIPFYFPMWFLVFNLVCSCLGLLSGTFEYCSALYGPSF